MFFSKCSKCTKDDRFGSKVCTTLIYKKQLFNIMSAPPFYYILTGQRPPFKNAYCLLLYAIENQSGFFILNNVNCKS